MIIHIGKTNNKIKLDNSKILNVFVISLLTFSLFSLVIKNIIDNEIENANKTYNDFNKIQHHKALHPYIIRKINFLCLFSLSRYATIKGIEKHNNPVIKYSFQFV